MLCTRHPLGRRRGFYRALSSTASPRSNTAPSEKMTFPPLLILEAQPELHAFRYLEEKTQTWEEAGKKQARSSLLLETKEESRQSDAIYSKDVENDKPHRKRKSSIPSQPFGRRTAAAGSCHPQLPYPFLLKHGK